MERLYVEDKTIDKRDFTKNELAKGDYEGCSFINCDFSNTNLAEVHFIDCTFTGCNLSMVKLVKTGFRDIVPPFSL